MYMNLDISVHIILKDYLCSYDIKGGEITKNRIHKTISNISSNIYSNPGTTRRHTFPELVVSSARTRKTDSPLPPDNITVSGWLSGKQVRLSHRRSWVRVPAGLYQRPS